MTNAELSRAIAISRGWKIENGFIVNPDGHFRTAVPNYTNSIEMAWELAEEMPAPVLYRNGKKWFFSGGMSFPEQSANSPAMAICKAYYEWQTHLAARRSTATEQGVAPDRLQLRSQAHCASSGG